MYHFRKNGGLIVEGVLENMEHLYGPSENLHGDLARNVSVLKSVESVRVSKEESVIKLLSLLFVCFALSNFS